MAKPGLETRAVPPPPASIPSGCALIGLPDLAHLRFTGAERREYLHAVTSQDVKSLGPWEERYGTFLTTKGRMIADVRFLGLPDAILLEVPASRAEVARIEFEKKIVMEEVQVAPAAFESWALVGFGAEDSLRAAGAAPPVEGRVVELPLAPGSPAAGSPGFGSPAPGAERYWALAFRLDWPGVEGIRLVTPPGSREAILEGLRAGDPARVAEGAREALEVLRVEAGIPLFGRDMDEETIPLEAGIEKRAISMTKGCYIGQEVVARIVFQGHVNRKIAGLRFPGAGGASRGAPAPGETVLLEGREVGRVTSVAASARFGVIGLGMIRREVGSSGTRLRTSGGADAEVAALPFTV